MIPKAQPQLRPGVQERIIKGVGFILTILLILSAGCWLWMTNEHTEESIQFMVGIRETMFRLEFRMNQLEIQLNATRYELETLKLEQQITEETVTYNEELIKEENQLLTEIVENMEDNSY